jgi:hypothetical protein
MTSNERVDGNSLSTAYTHGNDRLGMDLGQVSRRLSQKSRKCASSDREKIGKSQSRIVPEGEGG